MVTLGKPQRQHRILRVLEDQPVSSQAQLVQLLEVGTGNARMDPKGAATEQCARCDTHRGAVRVASG